MATTLIQTGVQFPDSSIQTTAATANIVPLRSFEFNASDSYMPTDGTKEIYIFVIGSTGGVGHSDINYATAGVGGGGFSFTQLPNPTGIYDITIGAGGIGSNSAGTAGGTTSISGSGITGSIRVTGSGGVYNTGTPSAGGLATGGSYNANGGSGGTSYYRYGYWDGGGGGGASGSFAGNGYAGGNAGGTNTGGGGGGGSGGVGASVPNNTTAGGAGGIAATSFYPSMLSYPYINNNITDPKFTAGSKGTNYYSVIGADYFSDYSGGRGGKGSGDLGHIMLIGLGMPSGNGGNGGFPAADPSFALGFGTNGNNGKIVIWELA